ncbi:PHP domain-containing protein [Gulosibacter massiliensis]|uniref:PHP domain-containing protein n=1 Tax=Gulosibacter massiliensis TaxID=2479839 RepID=UPI001F49CC40|nr:PHP domain-containing protein [Gulosibacter massiliensis]
MHLHVASAHSNHHGTNTPEQLVARAASWGAPAAALTDRDGLYGAVRHIRACIAAGIAPIVGVDLALAPQPRAESHGQEHEHTPASATPPQNTTRRRQPPPRHGPRARWARRRRLGEPEPAHLGGA